MSCESHVESWCVTVCVSDVRFATERSFTRFFKSEKKTNQRPKQLIIWSRSVLLHNLVSELKLFKSLIFFAPFSTTHCSIPFILSPFQSALRSLKCSDHVIQGAHRMTGCVVFKHCMGFNIFGCIRFWPFSRWIFDPRRRKSPGWCWNGTGLTCFPPLMSHCYIL